MSLIVTSDKMAFPSFSTMIVYSTESPTPNNPSPFSRTRTDLVALIDGSDPIGTTVGSLSSLFGLFGSSLISLTVLPCATP